jgi:hypothetical protein
MNPLIDSLIFGAIYGLAVIYLLFEYAKRIKIEKWADEAFLRGALKIVSEKPIAELIKLKLDFPLNFLYELYNWKSDKYWQKNEYLPAGLYQAAIREVEGIKPIGPFSYFSKGATIRSLKNKIMWSLGKISTPYKYSDFLKSPKHKQNT